MTFSVLALEIPASLLPYRRDRSRHAPTYIQVEQTQTMPLDERRVSERGGHVSKVPQTPIKLVRKEEKEEQEGERPQEKPTLQHLDLGLPASIM